MKLTTRGRYAVTAMLDLALHERHGPVPLADVSRRQDISLSYLEQLFGRMRRHGLVASTRGPGGGYVLARKAPTISIADVIRAVGEKVDVTRCAGQQDCQNGERCLTHDLWAELSDHIEDFLACRTLADLMQRRDVDHVARRQQRREETVGLRPARELGLG